MRVRTKAVILCILIMTIVSVVCAEDESEWIVKGDNAVTVGNYADAVTYYNYALALDKNNAVAMTGKAIADNYLGNYAEALSLANQALTITASSTKALNARAYALFKLQRYTDAVAAYNTLFPLDSTHADAYYYQGFAYVQLNQPDAALIAFDRSTSLSPYSLDAWNQKGLVLLAQGKNNASLDAFTHCTQLTIKNAEIWTNKGKALAALGRYSEANDCFSKALGINPLYADAIQSKKAIEGKAQVYLITGSPTPTEVPFRYTTTPITRKLAPHLPDGAPVTLVTGAWFYNTHNAYLVVEDQHEPVHVYPHNLQRRKTLTVAITLDDSNCGDDNPRIYVLLNGNDTPLALYGRDLDGYPLTHDDDV